MNDRMEVLRELLSQGMLSTQDELRVKLEKRNFRVTQSTISRDLRRIGAVRAVDEEGNTVYRLPMGAGAESAEGEKIVRSIQANNAMVVIHTSPGAASMVARQLDFNRSLDYLGTIAGDDTIFVALSSRTTPQEGVRKIRTILDEVF